MCDSFSNKPDPNIEFTEQFDWNDLPEEELINTLMFESDVKAEEAISAFRQRRGLE